MPTYDYRCTACGHTFDELQSFSDPVLTKCPMCKKNKLERLFGGGGAIIFKGSGFYETDYRRAADTANKDEAPAATGDTKAESKETKTETPAASTDAAPKSEGKSESKGESKGGGGTKKKGK